MYINRIMIMALMMKCIDDYGVDDDGVTNCTYYEIMMIMIILKMIMTNQ